MQDHDRYDNKIPGKRPAPYPHPSTGDEVLYQITPAKEKELLYPAIKKHEKRKMQRELILFPLSPDMDHPEQ
jgi:hypothetical protein